MWTSLLDVTSFDPKCQSPSAGAGLVTVSSIYTQPLKFPNLHLIDFFQVDLDYTLCYCQLGVSFWPL